MKLPQSRQAGIFLLVALAIALSYLFLARPYIDAANAIWLDHQFHLRQPAFPQQAQRDVVVVGIDNDFLDAVPEPLALTHPYLARLMQALAQGRPRAVGFDMVLPTKRFDDIYSSKAPERSYHATLLESMMNGIEAYPIVFAKVLDERQDRFQDVQVDYASILQSQRSSNQLPWPPLASIQFCPDADGKIRRYPGKTCQPDQSEWTFSASLAAAGHGLPPVWSGLSNYGGDTRITVIPIRKVLQALDKRDTRQLSTWFKDTVVLVGRLSNMEDTLSLPAAFWGCEPDAKRKGECVFQGTRGPGVFVHALQVRNMLGKSFIQPIPGYLVGILMVLCLSFWFGKRVVRKLVLFLAFGLALMIGSAGALAMQLWIPPFAVLYVAALALGARAYLEGWLHFRERQRLTTTFSGYVSPPILKELLQEDMETVGQPRECHICVLFSDLRGYTTLSEGLTPDKLLDVMNQYFETMADVVHRHGGTVDKFIGDGMLNYFGAPNHLDNPEQNAFNAARDMLVELAKLNARIAKDGFPEFKIGIGLHSGPAVVGNVGPSNRYDYTVVGDTVNTGSRVEGLSKKLEVTVVLSENAATMLDNKSELIDFGVQEIKGRSAIHVYGWDSQTALGLFNEAHSQVQNS